MQKIKNIEFFRFLFAIIICYHHMIINWNNMYHANPLFSHLRHLSIGGFCVDLFFIIAGYFLYYSISRSDSVLDLAIRKFKRLFPVFAVAIICAALFTQIKWTELVLNLLFLQSTAIPLTRGINVAAWFVSSLFLISIFYALIVKSFSKRQGLFFILICTFLAYSYTAKHGGDVVALENFFLTKGTIRGVAGMGLGYLLAEFLLRKGEQIKNFICSSWLTKGIITIFEILATVFVIAYVIFGSVYVLNRFIVIIAFTLLFICLILKCGYFSRFLENDISVFLGKYAYSIYLMQAVYNAYARKNFWKNYEILSDYSWLAIFLNIIGYVLLGVLVYHLVENPPQKLREFVKALWMRISGGGNL